jgi:hypothetical protein
MLRDRAQWMMLRVALGHAQVVSQVPLGSQPALGNEAFDRASRHAPALDLLVLEEQSMQRKIRPNAGYDELVERT